MLPVMISLIIPLILILILLFVHLIDLILPEMMFFLFCAMAGLVEHGRLARKFRCMGLRRKTISQAVSFFDMRCAKENHLEIPVSQPGSAVHSLRRKSPFEEAEERRQAAFRLAIKVGNNVEWPCTEIETMKAYLHKSGVIGTVLAVIAAGIVLMIPLAIVFPFLVLLLGVDALLLFCCVPTLLTTMYRQRITYFNRKGLDRVECSEDIELRQTVAQILNLLNRESRWPLLFHLAGDFDGLVYTGRVGTELGRFVLKEAVLYPTSDQSLLTHT
jgi:hypothetical protein